MVLRARDDEFEALFGECEDADEIEQIKNNDPALDEFCPTDVDDLTAEAWEKIGSYIAGNEHLRDLDLSDCNINPSKLRGLFGGAALRRITGFWCKRNRGIDSTCFYLLLDAMEGAAIQTLNVGSCSIHNLMALARCTLPNLQYLGLDDNGITNLPPEVLAKLTDLESLNLSSNRIGEKGFRALADLLRNEECSLKVLQLQSTGMSDPGATILADALKCNTKLETLSVKGNDLGKEAMGAFLRLLNDVSSIKKTEGSNHTLRDLGIIRSSRDDDENMKFRICKALHTNIEHPGNPEAAGRYKVLETQLLANTREELARLQGIECPGYYRLFSNLDAVLLPDVLELLDRINNERNELYPAIVARASDLVSLIHRETMLRGEKAKNVARIAAITAELARLNVVNSRIDSELTSIEVEERCGNVLGNKRSRDAAA